MAKVLRVELKFSILTEDFKKGWDSTNIGPYTGLYRVKNIGGYSFLHLRTSIAQTPEPSEDGMPHTPYGMLFGFKDMDQFINWFSSDMAELDWSGFALAEYEVPDDCIVHGRSQIAFSKEDATLIKYFDSCRRVWKDYHRQLYAA